MKATDVIKAYKNGERNFQRLNLRGANFKGQNLSGANFSYCQLQSANFSQANLTNTKFIGAKAGLQKRWVIILLLVSLVLIALSSSFAVFVGFSCATIFDPDSVTKLAGIATLISTIIFCWISYRKNLLQLLIFGLCFLGTGLGLTIVFAFVLTIILAIGGQGIIGTIGFVVPAVAGMACFAIILAYIAFLALAGATVVIGAIVGDKAIFVIYALVGIIAFLGGFTGKGILGGFVSLTLVIFACYLGYRTLKDETRDSWLRKIVIAFAALGGTSFYSATVTDTDFTEATLKNVNFNRAILTRTCFKDTVKLNLARPGKTLLANPTVRDLLINPSSGQEKDLSKADLRGAYLKEANLQQANLKYADISEATFEYANLSHVNLTEVNAVYTNFESAYLTGACLENWNIDATTILDNVDCQYVFLLENFNEHGSRERRPSSGDFQAGEFTKLFEEVFDTVDFIFENGIDWKAFIETMTTVQVENEDTPLEVSSIENKGDGVFVVKVKVPPDANKEKIHQDFNEVYQLQLEAVEAKYKAQLEAKENEITIYRQQSIDMMEIVKTQANRPINVEAETMNYRYDNSKQITTGDINSPVVFNLAETISDVNNTINQISESNNKENEQLKALLKQLMKAIETEDELENDEKAEAANKVKTITQASQNPEDQGLQKKATRAVKLLETLANGLGPATKLYTACHSILPQIVTFLGITL